jgi:hypothetical protein
MLGVAQRADHQGRIAAGPADVPLELFEQFGRHDIGIERMCDQLVHRCHFKTAQLGHHKSPLEIKVHCQIRLGMGRMATPYKIVRPI